MIVMYVILTIQSRYRDGTQAGPAKVGVPNLDLIITLKYLLLVGISKYQIYSSATPAQVLSKILTPVPDNTCTFSVRILLRTRLVESKKHKVPGYLGTI